MPREITFDRSSVINEITRIFLEKGYQATSMDFISKETGLKKTSLYNSFGNKDEIFKICVDHYFSNLGFKENLNFQSNKSLSENLKPVIYSMFFEGNDLLPGCLLVNSVLELSGVNDHLFEYVCAKKNLMMKLLVSSLKKFEELDLTKREVSISELTDFLTILIQGLRVQVRSGVGPEQVVKSIDSSLKMIGYMEKRA